MTQIKRRQFLQFAGSALATLGLGQLDIQRRSLRYAEVLAQSTPRKLALLVGINGYPGNSLKGCITDVYLQRELLIHRFGFNPLDILLVTDEASSQIKPTRQGILQAFEEHLIKQAKPGDVVVYHYSGHGSHVFDPDSGFADQLNSTFVPIDRSQSRAGDKVSVSDITGATLFLLMSGLQTENVTVVLDSCYSGGGKRGDLTIRAIEGGTQVFPSAAEQEYQQRWLSQLKMSPQEFKQKRQTSVAKGVVIASAKRDQIAADAPFDGFHAGAFTYVMTQYLWQLTDNQGIGTVLANVSRSTTPISSSKQVPEFEAKKSSSYETKPIYFLEDNTPPGEAVISKINGDRVEVWLGGVDAISLEAFGKGTVLALVDTEGNDLGLVQLESRDGLIGEGKLQNFKQPQLVKPGAILQERARAIPSDLTLRIGLDDSLGKDANQASLLLSKIRRLEASPLGEKEVHYILARMTDAAYQKYKQEKVTDIPPIGSIGLYGRGGDLIPGSFGKPQETVADAVSRLQPKLRSLLAARVVKLTLNADSSKLKVSTSLKILNANQQVIVASVFTARSLVKTEGNNQPKPVVSPNGVKVESGVAKLPLSTRVQLQVNNQEDHDLYVSVLVIDPEGEMVVIFPNSWTAATDATLVKARQTRLIPDPSQDQFKITIGKPLGIAEVLAIASLTPLREALLALQAIASGRGLRAGVLNLGEDSTKAIDTLLGDIDRGTRSRGTVDVSFDPDVSAVDTRQLAAMSITFEAVEGSKN